MKVQILLCPPLLSSNQWTGHPPPKREMRVQLPPRALTAREARVDGRSFPKREAAGSNPAVRTLCRDKPRRAGEAHNLAPRGTGGFNSSPLQPRGLREDARLIREPAGFDSRTRDRAQTTRW